jgi:hypothetical protein
VTNNGPGTLTNVTASFQGNGGGFAAQVDSACQNLAQGANCAVTVSFTPGQGNGTTATMVLTPQGGSGSVSIPVSISRATTNTSVKPLESVTYSTSSQNVTLTASVTSSAGLVVDEGTVTFTVNGTSLPSVPVSNGSASVSYTVPAGLAVIPSGYPIQAVYSGGPLFSGSSGSGTLTISQAATTTTALDSTATLGSCSSCNPTALLQAKVTSLAGTVSVGSVTFTVTDPQFGTTVGTATGAVSNGQATANLSFACTNTAKLTIRAVYDPSPSSNFTGSSGSATLDTTIACP